jgi:hypothetical protein
MLLEVALGGKADIPPVEGDGLIEPPDIVLSIDEDPGRH